MVKQRSTNSRGGYHVLASSVELNSTWRKKMKGYARKKTCKRRVHHKKVVRKTHRRKKGWLGFIAKYLTL